MRKRLCFLLIGVALLGGGWLTVLQTYPTQGITRKNIERIKEGMTQQEVENILGDPPGNYSAKIVIFLNYQSGLNYWPVGTGPRRPCPGVPEAEWVGEESAVKVGFDCQGRACRVTHGWVLRGHESFLDKVRRWVGL